MPFHMYSQSCEAKIVTFQQKNFKDILPWKLKKPMVKIVKLSPIYYGENVSRGTPMFPLEVLRLKRSYEISEKIKAESLSKNLDSNY